jgi:3-deoxy-D-manno-octulosonic-acid transferase
MRQKVAQQKFNMNQQQSKQIQIRANDADLKGAYSNVAIITHTQEEFVIDFMNVLGQNGVLSARVILSPGHMKRIIQALQGNMKLYEQKFGSITLTEEPKEDLGFQFSGNK